MAFWTVVFGVGVEKRWRGPEGWPSWDDLNGDEKGGASGSYRKVDGVSDEERVDLVESSRGGWTVRSFHDAGVLVSKRKRVHRGPVVGFGVAHVLAGERPLVEGACGHQGRDEGDWWYSPSDPCPEAAIECLEALGGPWYRGGRARRREVFLNQRSIFPFPGRLIGDGRG